MDDLIRRRAAIEAIHEDIDWLASQGARDLPLQECMDRAKSILTVLPAIEPRRGRWIESNPMNSADVRLITCSACGDSYVVRMDLTLEDWADGRNYCIRCGARMLEDDK